MHCQWLEGSCGRLAFTGIAELACGSLPGISAPCVSSDPGALLTASPPALSSRRQEQCGQRGQHRQHPQCRQRPEHRGHQRTEHQHPHREHQGRRQPPLPLVLLPEACPRLAWAGDGAPAPSLSPPAPPSKGEAAGAEHPPPITYSLLGLSGEMLLGGPRGLPPTTQLALLSRAGGCGWYHTASPPCPVSPERIKRALGQILPRCLARGQPFTR